ncbi:type II toxin-antitoxin system RelE/ParE family toxin [Phocaeicola faecalis]|uniref:type II toxin-antitoxin system RelE/ParE family toxin n=1 Tax=Phocaeicola faecalis TaxID=2786956 RepID=UPI001F25F81D|nr:type II toxin-antitoxin system RelE/ParE family toxin [Phocaeicola faecalis]
MIEKNKYIRQIIVYADYFKEFKKTLSRKTLEKVYQIFIYVMTLERIPERYLKAITSVKGLYEIRIEEGGNIYRIFCCLDEGNLVILFNGFQKKTQKTPAEEIERASRIMKEYIAKKERRNKV